MISACVFTVVLFHSGYWALGVVPSALGRRVLMGLAMGGTAVGIIRSPMGRRSGAHFNPAITLTYLRLGKVHGLDAFFYILFQFMGGIAGVGISRLVLGPQLADRGVEYAVTVPGIGGTAGAFGAEFLMGVLLMGVVLWSSNRPRIAGYTSYLVGCLIVVYIVVFAPVSGFSINPARTMGSAVWAGVWTGWWVYFTAPLMGMMAAAEGYVRGRGRDGILCAKLHPDPSYPCEFRCRFPGHSRVGQGHKRVSSAP